MPSTVGFLGGALKGLKRVGTFGKSAVTKATDRKVVDYMLGGTERLARMLNPRAYAATYGATRTRAAEAAARASVGTPGRSSSFRRPSMPSMTADRLQHRSRLHGAGLYMKEVGSQGVRGAKEELPRQDDHREYYGRCFTAGWLERACKAVRIGRRTHDRTEFVLSARYAIGRDGRVCGAQTRVRQAGGLRIARGQELAPGRDPRDPYWRGCDPDGRLRQRLDGFFGEAAPG